jgi:hypothetical protein
MTTIARRIIASLLAGALWLAAAAPALAQGFPGTNPIFTDARMRGAFDVQQAWRWTGFSTPAQITTDQNNYAPAGVCTTVAVLRLSASGTTNIHGLAGGVSGCVVTLHNTTSANIALVDESVSATAGNRFALSGASALLTISSGITLWYDGTSSRWRPVGILRQGFQNILNTPTTLAGYGITDAQPLDSDLTALAGNSTNGFWARTGAGTGAARTITGTANEICVTNGDGVSGAPTLALCSALTFTGKTITGGTFSGPALTGTVNIQQNYQISGDVTPTALSGSVNDYDPTGQATASTYRIDGGAANRDITGLAGGADGRELTLFNIGATNNLVLKNESGSSTAANRFAVGADITLAPGQSAHLWYDSTSSRWRAKAAFHPVIGGGAGSVTSVTCNGVTITASGTCPPTFGYQNCSIAASVASNHLTIALKDNAGNDPSAGSPCNVWFRSATHATGSWVQRTVTAATSVVLNSGSTLGTSNSTAFRVWVTLIDTGSTAVLGVSVQSTAVRVHPLNPGVVKSSTACNACTNATAAAVIYSTAAQTSRPFIILGYAEWGSGLATAGAWSSGPTHIQSFNAGVKRPGEQVQVVRLPDGALATGTTTIPFDNTTPQNTEGDQYLSQDITPESSANILRVRFRVHLTSSAASGVLMATLFQDSAANALATAWTPNISGSQPGQISGDYQARAATTSATTFKVRAGNNQAGTTSFNGFGGSAFFNGTLNSYLEIEEIMG